MKRHYLVLLLAALALPAGPASARDRGDGDDRDPPRGRERGRDRERRREQRQPLTVAIVDFTSNTPGEPELGNQIGEILAATLGGQEGVTLVERAAMDRALRELELNVTGLVGADDAVKIGKLVGAKILITGRAFAVGKQTYIAAKLIGTETTLVEPVIVNADDNTPIDRLVTELAEKVGRRLRERGPELVAAPEEASDPLPELKRRLAGRDLPPLAVRVPERHIAAPQPGAGRGAPDPAVETELKLLLTACGFTVIDGDERDLAAAGVDLEIGGEAFSEFSTRIGNLVSCAGRVELTVKDRHSGEVVFTDRETARGVDLSENLAGKIALQKAGRAVGVRMLRHFADELPRAGEGRKDEGRKDKGREGDERREGGDDDDGE